MRGYFRCNAIRNSEFGIQNSWHEFQIPNSKFLIFSFVAVVAIALSGLTMAAATDPRLIQAVKNRDVDSVRALLKQRVDVNATQGDGATALHWAAQRDDVAIADLLIRAAARANVADDLGATPLHVACTNRSGSMVERLLGADADPNATLLSGETALMT